MDFLASPFGVIIILAIVTIAAVSFEPTQFVGAWRELSKRYGTDKRPRSITFSGESMEVGTFNFTAIDAALDDDGFWLIYDGPNPKKAPECIFLPWDCVRYRQNEYGKQNFQLRGKKPIEIWVSTELGDAMQRRSMRFAVEDQL